MSPNRRTLLTRTSALIGALAAGCLGRPSNRGGSPSEGSEVSPTRTATRTPLPDTEVPWPAGPKERPPLPDELTRATVRSFVHTHEYRFVYNTLWMGESTEVSASCEVLDVAQVAVGYRAVVECTAWANAGGEPIPNSTETTTPVHADYFTQTYVYLLDEDSIVRREAPDEA